MPCETNALSFTFCRCACKWRCRCLIPRKRKAHPPFNTASKFGTATGLHPKLRAHPPDTLAVGSYDLPAHRTKCTVPCWDRQKELEEFSATLGGRVLANRVIQRHLSKIGCGPGTHEIPRWPDVTVQSRCAAVREDVGFGTVPRFHLKHKSTTPGPGYIPCHNFDGSRYKKSSSVPTFEFDGFVSRFRETRRQWSLPSNLYNPRHPGDIESCIKKVTGRRGPYDLFTGPRDESTIKGYFTTLKSTDKAQWPIVLPGEIDKMLHKSNYFKGLWTTCPRFPKKPVIRFLLNDISTCYKDPDQPGPGHYDIETPRKPVSEKKHPFNSSVYPARPYPGTEIRPGPGQYKLRDRRPVKGHGWTWIFKSKTRRTIALDPPASYKSF